LTETTQQVMELIETLHRGEREIARSRMGELWHRLPPDDRFHRCVLAHYMADAQDDAREELVWDLLAFEAASNARPEEFDDRFPGMSLASFFPSLHLNLASCYERIGEIDLARKHAIGAAAAAPSLSESHLGKLTADAIARLNARLDALGQGLSIPPT
jgi:hypothetical protein